MKWADNGEDRAATGHLLSVLGMGCSKLLVNRVLWKPRNKSSCCKGPLLKTIPTPLSEHRVELVPT